MDILLIIISGLLNVLVYQITSYKFLSAFISGFNFALAIIMLIDLMIK